VKTPLFVNQTALPAPSDEEYYFNDLIGCTVLLEDGSLYGVITSMDNYGASDIIEITYPNGEKGLYPFVDAVVKTVDVANRRMVILPLEVV
jgi:16S rRNA processing protein RimM